MKISFLQVSYNSTEWIASCLHSIIREAEGSDYEILLVDNGDGSTADLVRRQFPQVVVLPSLGNIGYGRGNNYLARHASGDLFLVVNPDAMICEGSIAELRRLAAARPDMAGFSGIYLRADGRLGPDNFLSPPLLLNGLAGLAGLDRLRRWWLARRLGRERQVRYPSGSFFALRRQAWEALGGFDESFFLYCEEIDLFHRLRRLNMRMLRSPRIRVIHEVASGEGFSPLRLRLHMKGDMHFCRKFRPAPVAAITGGVQWLLTLRRHLFRPGHRSPAEIRSLLAAMKARHWWRGYSDWTGPAGS